MFVAFGDGHALSAMFIGLRKFLVIDHKSFNVMVEGRGVRVFENGKGFGKSIFYQKGVLEWLLKCFKEFRWEKGEEAWGRCRHSSWRTL